MSSIQTEKNIFPSKLNAELELTTSSKVNSEITKFHKRKIKGNSIKVMI